MLNRDKLLCVPVPYRLHAKKMHSSPLCGERGCKIHSKFKPFLFPTNQ